LQISFHGLPDACDGSGLRRQQMVKNITVGNPSAQGCSAGIIPLHVAAREIHHF
jgi:hypothetical protein